MWLTGSMSVAAASQELQLRDWDENGDVSAVDKPRLQVPPMMMKEAAGVTVTLRGWGRQLLGCRTMCSGLQQDDVLCRSSLCLQ